MSEMETEMTTTPTKQPDLSREFECQAELIGLADDLAAKIPPVCAACGQTIEKKASES